MQRIPFWWPTWLICGLFGAAAVVSNRQADESSAVAAFKDPATAQAAGGAAKAADQDAAARAAEIAAGFSVPEGFRVSLYADDDLVHDCYSMTIDAKGRVVCAGRDYVKILHDTDHDGRADRTTLFSKKPASGAHGMYFDGNDLLVSGDNGLWRIPDADGDGEADGPGVKWSVLGHPEHGTNGVVKGPDGWVYVICGNDAGVSSQHAQLASSPIRVPNMGAVVRFTPDGKHSEVVAHGFRNPYDICFHPRGQFFTVDADGERDHHLPWYIGNRLFDIETSRHHGWVITGWQRAWNRPSYFFDNVAPLSEIGRGSPTGMECYQHTQFPERYRRGVFSMCWTFGRIYFHELTPAGSSYKAKTETFMQTKGTVGFAPVDMAVGPAGDLFVAIGGRGTRGGVFKVSYDPAAVAGTETKTKGVSPRTAVDKNDPVDPVRSVLTAPQPLSSWSRAAWVPAAKKLGKEAFEKAVWSESYSEAERARAAEVLTECFGGPTIDVAKLDEKEIAKLPALVRARLIWGAGRTGPLVPADGVQAWLKDPGGEQTAKRQLAQRIEWWMKIAGGTSEGLVLRELFTAMAGRPVGEHVVPVPGLSAAQVQVGNESGERRLRWAMQRATRVDAVAGRETAGADEDRLSLKTRLNARWKEILRDRDSTVVGPNQQPFVGSEGFVVTLLKIFQSTTDRDLQLECVRLLQIALGDLRTLPGQHEVYTGYVANAAERVSAAARQEIVTQVLKEFPTQHPQLDRELARLAGAIEVCPARFLDQIATRWTETSTVHDDIHYFITASLIKGERSAEVTRKAAHMLAMLHHKLTKYQLRPAGNWGPKLVDAYATFAQQDPKLFETLVADEAFDLPGQSLFVARMPVELQVKAARKLVREAQKLAATNEGDEPVWTAALVQLASVLPADECLPVLRPLWGDVVLRDAIAVVLAKHRVEEDRERLVEGLASMQASVVTSCAEALCQYPPAPQRETQQVHQGRAIQALLRFAQVKEAKAARQQLVQLVQHLAGGEKQTLSEEGQKDLREWYLKVWKDFAARHPRAAEQLTAQSGANTADWLKRLEQVAWDQGDATRGRKVFESKACHQCHLGVQRLGPQLAGAAQRMSRADLFVAIVDPHRDVSPLYQTWSYVTRSGQVHIGLKIYDSEAGSLIQTGPSTTVRLNGDEVVAIRPTGLSLMPVGLLNDITNPQLADLYAFLQSIKND